jgi:UDP-N-acetylmuramate dehydrogenase
VVEPVVRLGPAFADLTIEGDRVRLGAACDLAKAVAACAAAGLAGPEGLAGVPATVGGALRMNAGTAHCWIFDFVDRVEVLLPDEDQPRWLLRSEVPAVYRSCGLAPGAMFLGCELRCEPGDPVALRARATELKQAKAASQPLALRSAGCSFKNPSPEMPAGRLVDELGLKGCRVGAAVVSPVHANFIVNEGGARSRDVCHLIGHVRFRAWVERGVVLKREVEAWNCPDWLDAAPEDLPREVHDV